MDNIQNVLKKIEITAEQINLPIIGPKKGKFLAEIVKKHKPKQILEIGSLTGYSAILMAQFLPDGGKITSIEVRKESAGVARNNIREAGFSDKVEIVIGMALDVIPTLKGPFDMLFLDAAKSEYYQYIKSSEPLLSKRSIIVADNVKIFQKEVEDYVDYMENSGAYKSKAHDFGSDAMEVSEKI